MNDTLFEQTIAPLSREEFFRLPLYDRQAAWRRYLAAVDTTEEAAGIFLRSTGPMHRCWHAGCENLAAYDHWYCTEHRAIEESMTNLEGYGALSYGRYGYEEPDNTLRGAFWSVLFVVGGVCFVYLMIVLWGLLHGLSAPAAMGGPQ